MKRFFNSIVDFLSYIGKVKAASELSRAGYYKEAQEIMKL